MRPRRSGRTPQTVFLTQGRLQLAAFAERAAASLCRALDRPAGGDRRPAERKLILARGPFTLDDELELMRDERDRSRW